MSDKSLAERIAECCPCSESPTAYQVIEVPCRLGGCICWSPTKTSRKCLWFGHPLEVEVKELERDKAALEIEITSGAAERLALSALIRAALAERGHVAMCECEASAYVDETLYPATHDPRCAPPAWLPEVKP